MASSRFRRQPLAQRASARLHDAATAVGVAVLAFALMLSAAFVAHAAGGIGDGGYYRFETYTAFSQWDGTPQDCSTPGCQDLGTINGGAVNTSDHDAIQEVDIANAQYGEQFTFQALAPDGSVFGQDTLTYDGTDCGCDGCWNWDNQPEFCAGSGGYVLAWAGPQVNCQPTGTWTLNLLDNGTEVIQHTFDLEHNANGPLGISSPAPNQLFDLDQNNYTQTDNVPYIAGTDTGNLISWAATLNYKTSGGYGFTFDTLPGFGTTNMEEQDETYQSEGGQVQVTASTTASDGSTIEDCVTYYVDGDQSPSPLDPTSQLLSLYSSGATPHLMTGLANHESGYSQFHYPGDGSPPEPVVFNGIDGLWPYESAGGGEFIGLMMVPVTESDAWDWTQNTGDGVNSTVYGFAGEKLPTAQNLVDWLTGTKKNKNVPVHQGLQAFSSPSTQFENMALVLYGQYAKSGWAQQFYIPVCPPPGAITAHGNTWTCNGASWYWAPNDPNLSDPGADQNVQAQYVFAPGTSGSFGNRQGLQYVTNSSSDPWHDSNIQGGVLQEMK